jgi:hypothetical protein
VADPGGLTERAVATVLVFGGGSVGVVAVLISGVGGGQVTVVLGGGAVVVVVAVAAAVVEAAVDAAVVAAAVVAAVVGAAAVLPADVAEPEVTDRLLVAVGWPLEVAVVGVLVRLVADGLPLLAVDWVGAELAGWLVVLPVAVAPVVVPGTVLPVCWPPEDCADDGLPEDDELAADEPEACDVDAATAGAGCTGLTAGIRAAGTGSGARLGTNVRGPAPVGTKPDEPIALPGAAQYR